LHCPDARALEAARVRVMTINLRHDSDEWIRRFVLVADEIARLDPDIVGMQELQITRTQADVINTMLARRGHAPYFATTVPKTDGTGEGIGILSRWPVLEHAAAPIGDQRVVIFARVNHPVGVFDVVDTHLDQHRDEAVRAREAERVLGFIAQHDDCRPTILTGDMNSGENHAAVRRFRGAGFVDSYRAVHASDHGNTAMVKLDDGAFHQRPRRRIDFVLARAAGERTLTPIDSIVCFQNHDPKGYFPSDHFGVMTTFDLRL
jgi:endonuclease/exonuclease/phosphatase family metal-dependent hydrolase